jgi:hypothetical protein
MGLAGVLDRRQKKSKSNSRPAEFPAWHAQLQPVQLRHVA